MLESNLNNENRFTSFRVRKNDDLWEFMNIIKNLEKKGVIRGENLSSKFWDYDVVRFNEIPRNLKVAIIKSGQYMNIVTSKKSENKI